MKLIYNGQPLKTALPSFGEGLTFLNDELSVQYPTIPITKSEFDALTDEQKQGILYIVTDAEVPKQFYSGMTVYSEEETVIGAYNGKPLYRKVVSGTTPTKANTWSTFASNAIGSVGIVDQMTLCIGVFYQTGNTCIPMPNKLGDTHWIGIYYDNGDDRIGIVCGNTYATGVPGIVILEYTKTTDPEGTVTPLPVNYVQDYDTEDGWHVRKYSDGYVEMFLTKSVTLTSDGWEVWGRLYIHSTKILPVTYPMPLVTLYDEICVPGVVNELDGESFSLLPARTTDYQQNRLTKTKTYSIIRPVNIATDATGSVQHIVRGRWK